MTAACSATTTKALLIPPVWIGTSVLVSVLVTITSLCGIVLEKTYSRETIVQIMVRKGSVKTPCPYSPPTVKVGPGFLKHQALGVRFLIVGHFGKVSIDPAASARFFLPARGNNQAFPALFSSM